MAKSKLRRVLKCVKEDEAAALIKELQEYKDQGAVSQALQLAAKDREIQDRVETNPQKSPPKKVNNRVNNRVACFVSMCTFLFFPSSS